jgi:hypothetical protein
MSRGPEDRADYLDSVRKKANKKISAPVRKGKRRAPGELEFKKDMMIILKVAGYSHNQIGAALGEHRDTVNGWFQEPDTAAKYLKVAKELTSAARRLLETYTVEAIQTIADLMRDSNDEAIILKAATEILDRGGLPKVSRSEQKQERHDTHTFGTDDETTEALRALSPELQEQAAQMMDELVEFLNENAKAKDQEPEPDAS